MRPEIQPAEAEVKASPHSALKDYKHICIVAGSRGFHDYVAFSEAVFKYLKDRDIPKGEIIFMSGKAASGADAMIIRWCKEHGYPWTEHPANWDDISSRSAVVRRNRQGKEYNVLAGHWRNAEMAELANALLTFYDGVSPGTRDMMERMEKLKHSVRCVLIQHNDEGE